MQTTGLLAPRDGRAVELRTGECREGHCLLGFDAFVYINVIWFGCWIGFGIENYPYGLLTMVVSLEAIFLSTFVLISHAREVPAQKPFSVPVISRC